MQVLNADSLVLALVRGARDIFLLVTINSVCICEDCQHFVVFVLELSCDVQKMSSNKPKQQKHKRRLYGGQKRHLLNLGKYAASLMVVVVSSPGWPMWKLVSMIPFYIGSEKDLSEGVE